MISISHLSKKLGNVQAIDDLSVEFSSGINGLVGQNGAGKSTLFRLIADVYSPDNGSINIDNNDSSSALAKASLFYLSDDPYCQNLTTIKNFYKLYECYYNVDVDYLFSLCNKLSLPVDRHISSFSKGMKRQAFLCLALSLDVKYLLLDEAFDGIDPLAMELIKEELIAKYANSDRTLVIASHNIETLQRLCDRFVIISYGKKVNEGNDEDMSKAFIKIQIATNEPITEETLEKLNIKPISINKVGSIYEIILMDFGNDYKKILKDALNPLLIDVIPISYSEIIALQMLVAKKEAEHHE